MIEKIQNVMKKQLSQKEKTINSLRKLQDKEL